MTKMVKMKDEDHAKLLRYCTKDKTLGECIAGLLAGEPFVTRLREVLPRTIAGIEANKKGEQRILNVADDLVKVAQWIVNTCETRSGKSVDEGVDVELVKPILERLRELVKLVPHEEEEIIKSYKEILDELDRAIREA